MHNLRARGTKTNYKFAGIFKIVIYNHMHTHTHRQGVLLSTELQNLPLLLPRLGRTHSLFSQPHPLSKSPAHATSESSDSGSGCAENNEETALASLEDFHSAFLHYCIENGFASLMYHYMDYYR